MENDASILKGCAGAIRTNRALLEAARAANPDATILYKPHPDVEAGLRPGAVMDADRIADLVQEQTNPAAILSEVDEIWTLTSLMGFEGLLRGVRVTCIGTPFYAGWGLTNDISAAPSWRKELAADLQQTTGQSVDLDNLVHAALIAYPRYYDPVTQQTAPVEVILDRLASGQNLPRALGNSLLAKLQGVFATQSWIWRR